LLQVPAYVLALGSVVSVVVSGSKGAIEQLLPPQNRWHDLFFTAYPVGLSLALVVGYTLTHGGDVFWSVVWGLLSGFWSVGTYQIHTRTRAGDDGSASAGASSGTQTAQRVIDAPAEATVSVTVPPTVSQTPGVGPSGGAAP
jgi:hypothetical protein